MATKKAPAKAAKPAVKKAAAKPAAKKPAAKKVEKLAIDGGKKVYNGKWPAWPTFNEKTYDKVVDILKSGKVN